MEKLQGKRVLLHNSILTYFGSQIKQIRYQWVSVDLSACWGSNVSLPSDNFTKTAYNQRQMVMERVRSTGCPSDAVCLQVGHQCYHKFG